MAEVVVNIKGRDRQTLLQLVKQERRSINKNTVDFNPAQKRAVEFYEDHLKKVQKKLDPKATYLNTW